MAKPFLLPVINLKWKVMTLEWLESCAFSQDYYKALEDADEKVQLANQIYDLVSKKKKVYGALHLIHQ